jgi:hypothetical protein
LEAAADNKLESKEKNDHTPQLHIIFLKFLVYVVMYVMIPYYLIFKAIPKFMLLVEQIIPEFGIGIIAELLSVLMVFVVYKKVTSIISGKLQFNLKNEWIEYLTLKGRKI